MSWGDLNHKFGEFLVWIVTKYNIFYKKEQMLGVIDLHIPLI
jgi:hypothetical protein